MKYWRYILGFVSLIVGCTQANISCEKCCSSETFDGKLSCCSLRSSSRCLGLPCCDIVSSQKWDKPVIFPCLPYPQCRGINPGGMCLGDNSTMHLTDRSLSCDQPCCKFQMASNRWRTKTNTPGRKVKVEVSFDPQDYKAVFANEVPSVFILRHVLIEVAQHWRYPKNPECEIVFSNEIKSKIPCSRGNLTETSTDYLMVEFKSDPLKPYSLIIHNVSTPSGFQKQNSNLFTYVHFLSSTSVNSYTAPFVVEPITVGTLSSGYLNPVVAYPGSAGEISLVFETLGRIPLSGKIQIVFDDAWSFDNSKWSLKVVDAKTTQQVILSSTNENFKVWTLTVPIDVAPGVLEIVATQVTSPPSTKPYILKISTFDSFWRPIDHGVITTFKIGYGDNSITPSPYNYVSIVIFMISFVFCAIVTRINGLSFSSSSIWTDLTATCALASLSVDIINSGIWVFLPGPHFYYISCARDCITWTMLLAVCFHWASVLNLRLRKVPRRTTTLTFLCANIIFYCTTLIMVTVNRDLVTQVYSDSISTKCDGLLASKWKYSDIQPYIWDCVINTPKISLFVIWTNATLGLFVVVTILVMALGLMVLRKGKQVLQTSSGPEYHVLSQALRLYYALIGIVTAIYVVSWLLQVSLFSIFIEYPWWYLFAVWLPNSIPPGCFVFLQWNSAASTLRQDGNDEELLPYAEIRTPSITFSSPGRWSRHSSFNLDSVDPVDSETADGQMQMSLSITLTTTENLAGGCYVALDEHQVALNDDDVDPSTPGSTLATTSTTNPSSSSSSSNDSSLLTNPFASSSWKRIGRTDTAIAAHCKVGDKYKYDFVAVVQVPLASTLTKVKKLRFIAYEALDPARESTYLNRLFDDSDDEEVDQNLMERKYHRCICEFTTTSSAVRNASSSPSSLVLVANEGSFRTRSDLCQKKMVEPILEIPNEDNSLCTIENSSGIHQLDTNVENSLPPTFSSPPELNVRTVMMSKPSRQPNSHIVTRQFHIQMQGILVVEDLTESIYSNEIPRQLLEILIRQRARQKLQCVQDLEIFRDFEKQRVKGLREGMYETLIDQIQEDGDMTNCRSWLEQRVNRIEAYLSTLRRGRRVCVYRQERDILFKPSTEKKAADLRFLPINLHLQEMWVGPAQTFFENQNNVAVETGLYDTVTVGAMAAHLYKFKNGGLQSLEQQYQKYRKREDYERSRNPIWNEEERKVDDLKWEILMRMDVCYPQAVAALTTAFARKIDLVLQDSIAERGAAILRQYIHVGFLFQVESLLSTHGNEVGMLEDMVVAVSALSSIRFLVVKVDDEDCSPVLPGVVSVDVFSNLAHALRGAPWVSKTNLEDENNHKGYVIRVVVRTTSSNLWDNLKSGMLVSVFPLLFTQGINEKQTIANSTSSSKTQVQEVINHENFSKLKTYCNVYIEYVIRTKSEYGLDPVEVEKTLSELEKTITESMANLKKKRPELLQQSSDFCRSLNAGRVTCCKSAKDRTSMSVTLEQGRLLVNKHNLPKESMSGVVAVMRSSGVRLENAMKNTGKRMFAFNALQRSLLPEEYRCPTGTGGANIS